MKISMKSILLMMSLMLIASLVFGQQQYTYPLIFEEVKKLALSGAEDENGVWVWEGWKNEVFYSAAYSPREMTVGIARVEKGSPFAEMVIYSPQEQKAYFVVLFGGHLVENTEISIEDASIIVDIWMKDIITSKPTDV